MASRRARRFDPITAGYQLIATLVLILVLAAAAGFIGVGVWRRGQPTALPSADITQAAGPGTELAPVIVTQILPPTPTPTPTPTPLSRRPAQFHRAADPAGGQSAPSPLTGDLF